ncbi:PREDICTED: uncharacterized protein LOC106110798 [Papilio polytes]|uniref:uncharacterized protein LOC106110798 n=1 Tax=Papilio polytes TaxID=76194 RepID=UPI000675C3B4|nr:PREDICTED: uncharacterized protein LOC106110798 [Papilio polytes]
MLVITIISAFLLFNCVDYVFSIRCYDCNSANNSMCLDPTVYDAETVRKFLGTIDCQADVEAPNRKDFFCRKIVQTIMFKGHEPEVRVTRGCGWVRHHRDCYKADNEDHLETVCQCFQDDCNAGTALSYTTFLVTALGILVICL